MKILNITTSVSKREPCGTPLLEDEVCFDGGLQRHEARRIIAGYQWEGCLSKAFFLLLFGQFKLPEYSCYIFKPLGILRRGGAL